jgi:hypothetical protein
MTGTQKRLSARPVAGAAMGGGGGGTDEGRTTSRRGISTCDGALRNLVMRDMPLCARGWGAGLKFSYISDLR